MKVVHSGAELAKVLREVGRVTSKEIAAIHKELMAKAWRSVGRRSAVDTGFLRSKWDVVIDSLPPEEVSVGVLKGKDSYPAPGFPNLGAIKAGSISVIYNNTKYAMALETGGPYQRAQPMVEPTIAQILAEAKVLSDKLSRKRSNV